tara:strand:+ start:734 stop:1018 length:285 start_codon:yes stop_codon:yes gene_type:complete
MTTEFKNNTPFLLGILFFALVTAHEIDHITEAFEIEDEAFELGCEYCEENQSQDLEDSKKKITFVNFDIEDSKLVSLNGQSKSRNYHQRAPPKI